MPQTAQPNRQTNNARGTKATPLAKQVEAPTEDQVYGLVSVLYHSLQGAQACEQYMDDAERAGDDELVQFFEQCHNQQTERATRAKRLLADRVEESPEDDEVGDSDEDAEDV